MRRVLAYLGMAAVAGAAAVLSFDSLWGLARLAGIRLPWLLPVAIDAYALTSTGVWLQVAAPGSRAHRFARWNAFAAITLSILGNAAYHGFTAAGIRSLGPDRNGWIVAVLVAAVAPAALYAVAHLWSLVSSDQWAADGAGPVTAPVPDPEVPAQTVTPTKRTPSPRRRDRARTAPTGTGAPKSRSDRTDQMRDYLRNEITAGRDVVLADIDRKFGTKGYAKKVRAQVLAERNGHQVPEPVA